MNIFYLSPNHEIKNIHRIETLSEVELYEVSTPHLDDVIRLDDDTIVFPGHGPKTTIGFERDNNPFI